MKHSFKKIVYLTLIIMILASSLTLAENEIINKDETVYVKLNSNGTVESIIVVNRLFNITGNEIHDYGDYQNIKPLTNNIQPTLEGGQLIWYNPNGFKEDFYYQGTIDKELPVHFEIIFFLNGNEIKSKELAGKSGELKIEIKVKQNPNIDENQKNAYLTQIQIPLDLNKVQIIESPKSMKIVTGTNIMVSYSVLPNTDDNFTLVMDVKDFEMKSMQITLISYDAIMSEDYNELTDGLGEMKDGMREINDGTSELKDGLTDLVSGVKDLEDGLTELNNGGQKLETGLGEYQAALTEFSDGLNTVATGLNDATNGLGQLYQNSDQLVTSYNQLYLGLEQLQQEHEQLGLIAQSLLHSPDPNMQALGRGIIAENEALKNILMGFSQANNGLNEYSLGLTSVFGGISEINLAITRLSSGSADLTMAYDQMVVKSKEFFIGIDTTKNGVSKMYTQIDTLPNDVGKLIDGQDEITNGISEIKSSIEGGFDSSSSDKIHSFVDSDKVINSIQFLLITPEVKIDNSSQQIDTDDILNVESWYEKLWNKIIGLFK